MVTIFRGGLVNFYRGLPPPFIFSYGQEGVADRGLCNLRINESKTVVSSETPRGCLAANSILLLSSSKPGKCISLRFIILGSTFFVSVGTLENSFVVESKTGAIGSAAAGIVPLDRPISVPVDFGSPPESVGKIGMSSVGHGSTRR